ncbi:hypothetical protein RI065_10430 [Mycoplasmatota bacterium zrk1]
MFILKVIDRDNREHGIKIFEDNPELWCISKGTSIIKSEEIAYELYLELIKTNEFKKVKCVKYSS